MILKIRLFVTNSIDQLRTTSEWYVFMSYIPFYMQQINFRSYMNSDNNLIQVIRNNFSVISSQ